MNQGDSISGRYAADDTASRAHLNRRKRMADQQFIRALDASSEVELTVTGRASGREISIPVWFVRERDTLYLVPVNGTDSDWYKNMLKHPTIRLSEGDTDLSARATP